MSLKSFDKFCEDLILTEPGSQKIIYDERQKIMQMKIGIETLMIFGGAATLNCLAMDLIYQYSESYTAPIVLIMLFCAFYYNLRCAAKDCLVGINGERGLRTSSYTCIGMGVVLSLQYIFKEEHFIIVSGQLSDDFIFLITTVTAIVFGVTMLILVSRIQKKKNENGNEKSE